MNVTTDNLDAKPGEVITFYSYKGGTGRSMLLANVGWQLASAGRRVLLIDWDLEAPGLHRYFRPFLGDDPELREQEGVMEWMTDYWEACLDEPETSVDSLVRNYADPRHYIRELDTAGYLSGRLDLLCAGRQNSLYAPSVSDFDWTKLYQKLRGEQFIDVSKSILVGPGGYDYVLVDSRTGVSDTSGFCTVSLADTLVVCFTYNNQSVIGASQIARDIKRQAEERRPVQPVRGEARRFRLFAVPSRVDDLEPDRLEVRQKHAWEMFADLLTDVAPNQQSSYWLSVQVRNHASFGYEELLAACVNRPSDPQSVLGSVTQLTRILTDDAFTELPALEDSQRRELREAFGAVTEGAVKLSTYDAWRIFEMRVPDAGTRDSLLHDGFPLLVQLFTVAASSQAPGQASDLVRTMLLEGELTSDERHIAESLISTGIARRRITDDRQRGLTIADDSIYANWAALRQRLQEHLPFIEAREQIRQIRRTWESAGRSISALRTLQGAFSEIELDDERRAWLGRPNLQFFQAAQEMRAIDIAERESRDRIAKLESRIADLEAQREKRELEMQANAELLRRETQRAEGSRVRFRSAAVAAVVLPLMFGSIAYRALGQSEAREAQTAAHLASLKAESDTIRAAETGLKAKLDEIERQRAAESAMRYYGEGNRLVVQAGRPGGANYQKQIDAAIAAFSRAIELDPRLAEAYRGRAMARINSKPRDESAELQDWAVYYDLRPSLNGRSKLILRALDENPVDDKLVGDQLTRLAEDVGSRSARDASPRRVGTELEANVKKFPKGLQTQARTVITILKSATDLPAVAPPARGEKVSS